MRLKLVLLFAGCLLPTLPAEDRHVILVCLDGFAAEVLSEVGSSLASDSETSPASGLPTKTAAAQ